MNNHRGVAHGDLMRAMECVWKSCSHSQLLVTNTANTTTTENFMMIWDAHCFRKVAIEWFLLGIGRFANIEDAVQNGIISKKSRTHDEAVWSVNVILKLTWASGLYSETIFPSWFNTTDLIVKKNWFNEDEEDAECGGMTKMGDEIDIVSSLLRLWLFAIYEYNEQ